MIFNVITIFPGSFESYLASSILKRAQKNGLISIKLFNQRDFTKDKHKTVDNKPFGGGPGMVLKAEPIIKAIQTTRHRMSSSKSKVILLSARGKQFNQKMAIDWAKKYKNIILISGRYEGIDERVKKI